MKFLSLLWARTNQIDHTRRQSQFPQLIKEYQLVLCESTLQVFWMAGDYRKGVAYLRKRRFMANWHPIVVNGGQIRLASSFQSPVRQLDTQKLNVQKAKNRAELECDF
jgi:hypothetical protein